MKERLFRPGRSALPAFILVLLVLGGWFAYTVARENAAADAFAKALQNAGIQATVRVRGTTYGIANGQALAPDGSAVSGYKRFPILRTAYALVLARRLPFLDITGSDPAALASSTDALEEAASAMAHDQATEQAAEAVEHALYPFAFLRALAALEEARAAFAASGSDQDARAYTDALTAAAAAGARDLASFSKTFDEEAGTENQTLLTLSGAISLNQMRAALQDIRVRFKTLESALRAQERCLSGAARDCRADLSLPLPPLEATSSPVAIPAAYPPYLLSGDPAQNSYLVLGQSACLREEPGPYLFLYNPSIPSRMPLHYAGGAFFSSTPANNGPVIRYLRETYGMTYLLLEPLQFYECPGVATDIGRSYALLATVAFAKQNPDYARAERAALLDKGAYSDGAALAYVRAIAQEMAATRPPEQDPALTQFEAVLREWRSQSAGLDVLVANMAAVLARDEYLTRAGAPFDISAQTMFLTHSAFLSLFLSENPSAGTGSVTPPAVSPGDLARLSAQFASYQMLAQRIPLSQLRHDIESFAQFEGLSK